MAELRSFVIGVTIAGALLLFAGLAFGLFGDDSSGSPSVRLLGTPPATRTPAPAATRDPREFTPVAPTGSGVTPARETPGLQSPVSGTPAAPTSPAGPASPATQMPAATSTPVQPAAPTPTLETAPTLAPTEAPTATPEVNDVADYVNSANEYTPSLVAQIEYLVSNTNSPSLSDPSWRSFTIESAQYIQGLASGLASISPPACVSSAHGSLVAAANQASAAASAAIAAVEADDVGALTAAGGSLSAARDSIDTAIATVSTTVGSSC